MRSHLAALTLAVAVAASPSLAAAQAAAPYPPCDRTPTDAEVAAAKGAFQAGNASFNEADYARAITYWEDAYRRDCTAHPLLLNLARVYELDGQREKAVAALETYVTRNPGSPDEAQIRRRIDKLKEQIAANAAPEPQPETPPPIESPPPEKETPPPAAVDEEPTGKRPLWPLIVAGAGGAVGVVGLVLYATASSDLSSFEDECGPDHSRCPDAATASDANSARTRQTIGGAVAIGGFAVGAAALVYYFVAPPSESTGATSQPKSAIPRVSPWVGVGSTGLSVSGTF
jgi:tetratricopeptide (TPR) repeat protein